MHKFEPRVAACSAEACSSAPSPKRFVYIQAAEDAEECIMAVQPAVVLLELDEVH